MRLYSIFTAMIAVGFIVSCGAASAHAKIDFQEFLTGIPAAQGHWTDATWEAEPARRQAASRADYRAPVDTRWVERSIRRTQYDQSVDPQTVTNNVQVEEVPRPLGRSRISPPENVIGETVYIQDPDGYYSRDEYPGETISGPAGQCGGCDECSQYGDCGRQSQCGDCNDSYGSYNPWEGYEVGARMGGPFPHLGGTMWVLFSKYMSFSSGVQSFKGPLDFGQNGNYGFHGGLNFGIPFGYRGRLGVQAGIAVTSSDLSGYSQPVVSSNSRDQFFFTAGIFKRAECGGWQWGLAFDIMNDSFYDESTLTQIRPEIGHVFGGGRREIGFFGAYGADKQEVVVTQNLTGTYQSVDMNAFYYRRYFTYGGEGRVWAGFTGYGDGLLGADLRLPIGGSWAVEGGFNYLIPRGSKNGSALDRESWGLTLQLVWTPTRSSRQESKRRHRPLFSVANNNTFMTHFRPN